jgi:hypothetical protein
MNTEIVQLNQKLIPFLKQPVPLGLLSGKMGYSIYFFEMGRIMEDRQYTSLAEDLLDVVCRDTTRFLPLDIENGLTGIGLGIDYLIRKKHVGGNANEILEKIDISVFKALPFPDQKSSPIDVRIRIQMLYYLAVRCQSQKSGSDREYIFREMIYQLLNSLAIVPETLLEEPYSFSIRYQLPFFLYSLGQVAGFENFRHKVRKIVDEITPKVISLIPVSHAHRLYLLLGMCHINRMIHHPSWHHHGQLLKREIDINHMISNEMRDKNLFFTNGLTGVYFLLNEYNRMMSNMGEKFFLNMEGVRRKMATSSVWSKFKDDDQYFKTNSGLNGFCGMALAIMSLCDIYQ